MMDDIAAVQPLRTLRPTRGWVAVELREIVEFRDLLLELARRDVTLRYRQTLLGIAWVLLQPLFAAAMLTFAFGVVAGLKAKGTSSFLFTYAGLLVWNAFAWTLSKSSLSMVGNAYLVSKVYFPRLILPLSGTLSTLLDFTVSLSVLVLGLAALQIWPGWPLLLLPVWILFVIGLGLGAGLICAALTVRYRDIQHILPVLVPFLLYASPVAYQVEHIPVAYRSLFYVVNPLAGLIGGFRWSTLGTAMPPVPALIWSIALSTGLFLLGAAVFRRTERQFADAI